MNLAPVADALDIAIAKVAEAEYDRLSAGRPAEHVAQKVDQAVASFLRLARGISPAYDEWDALFYLTWYQPRQVNLALALAWPFDQEPQPLHIIDVGCGSLAMQIAMAIAVARSGLPEQDIYIELHGIDPSDAMTRIGRLLLCAFSDVVRSDPVLSRSRLRMACDRTQEHMGVWRNLAMYYRSDRAHEGGIYPSPNCWLTALHAVYASNYDQMYKIFQFIRRQSDPAYEVVTCHKVGYASAQLICRRDARQVRLLKDRFAFSGHLHRTTSLRQQLARRSPTSDMTRRLLAQPVPWNPPQDDRCIMWYFLGIPE